MKIKLRKTHWEQLLWYITLADQQDTYYGNWAQFERRYTEIVDFLKQKIKETK